MFDDEDKVEVESIDKKPERHYIVSKNNSLLSQRYDLTMEELKLVLSTISVVQPNDEDFKYYNLKISDLMELFGTESRRSYEEIPRIARGLRNKGFSIINKDGVPIDTAWILKVRYPKNTGTLQVLIDPDLKPYIINLQSLYTSYELNNILQMKSKYSIRIYEFLKSWQFKKQGYEIIDVDELRRRLVLEDVYPLYADFKRYVLSRAEKEINEKTDISFSMEEIKTNKKVSAIKFIIRANNKLAALPEPKGEKTKIAPIFKEQGLFLSQKNEATLLEQTNAMNLNTDDWQQVASWLKAKQKQGKIKKPIPYLLADPESIITNDILSQSDLFQNTNNNAPSFYISPEDLAELAATKENA